MTIVWGDPAGRFDTDALPHAYTYNTSGNVLTDTCTNGTNTWVKTYTYTGSNLTSESAWVKQ